MSETAKFGCAILQNAENIDVRSFLILYYGWKKLPFLPQKIAKFGYQTNFKILFLAVVKDIFVLPRLKFRLFCKLSI